MLQSGKITEAIPLLEALSKEDANSELILYNLGLAYSEIGEFDDAILRLKRLIKINPKHSNAWTGVGVAYQKLGNFEAALDAMTKAVELDGTNGYANRNLGAILMSKSRYNEALNCFRVARKYLPHDPQTLFGLASALQEIGDNDSIEEASELYKIIIQRWPASQVAELAQKSSTAIASKNLKQNAQGQIRSDVVFYISGALDLFKNISDSDMKNLIFEIAAKGQTGLDINDSEKKYTIKSLPGKFSGLNLLSIMYAGLKKIDPSIDVGIDFSQEYGIAIDLQKNDK